MKYILCLIVLLSIYSGANAQSFSYEGEWYVSFNDNHRHFRGRDCAIIIERDGQNYNIKPYKEFCSEYLPKEGKYTVDKDGNLTNGEVKLKHKGKDIIYNNDGMVEFRSMKSFKESETLFMLAKECLDKADSSDPNKQADFKKSIQYSDRLLADDGKCLECIYNRGLAWLRLEKMDSCAADYNKMMQLDSDYQQTAILRKAIVKKYNLMAWNSFGEKGDLKGAIRILNKALKIDSTYSETWYNLGGAWFTDKQYEKAINAFKKCLLYDPENEDAKTGLNAAVDAVDLVPDKKK